MYILYANGQWIHTPTHVLVYQTHNDTYTEWLHVPSDMLSKMLHIGLAIIVYQLPMAPVKTCHNCCLLFYMFDFLKAILNLAI